MAETLALIRQELDDAAKYLSELRTEQEERMGHIKQSLATLRSEPPVARERDGRGRDAVSGQGLVLGVWENGPEDVNWRGGRKQRRSGGRR